MQNFSARLLIAAILSALALWGGDRAGQVPAPKELSTADWNSLKGAHERWQRRAVEAPQGARAVHLGQGWTT